MKEDDSHGRLVVIMDREDGSFFLIREGLTDDDDDEKIDDPGFFVPASDMEAFCHAALSFIENAKREAPAPAAEEDKKAGPESVRICEQGLPFRLVNLLTGIFSGDYHGYPKIDILDLTLGDICKHSRRDYLRFRNFGGKSLLDLETILNKYNLELKR